MNVTLPLLSLRPALRIAGGVLVAALALGAHLCAAPARFIPSPHVGRSVVRMSRWRFERLLALDRRLGIGDELVRVPQHRGMADGLR